MSGPRPNSFPPRRPKPTPPPERPRCQGKLEFEMPQATRVSRIITKGCPLPPLPGEIYCARHLEEPVGGVRYCHEHEETYLAGEHCPGCMPPRELPMKSRRAAAR